MRKLLIGLVALATLGYGFCNPHPRRFAQQRTQMVLELNQTVTGDKVFDGLLGLPVCSADPPLEACGSRDICIAIPSGMLYVCPSGLWIEGGGSGGAEPGGNDTELQYNLGGSALGGIFNLKFVDGKVVSTGPVRHASSAGGSNFTVVDNSNSACGQNSNDFTLEPFAAGGGGFYWCSDGDPETTSENNFAGDGLAAFSVGIGHRINVAYPFLFKDWRIMDFTDIYDISDPNGPTYYPGIDCPTADPVALNATDCTAQGAGAICTTRGDGVTGSYGVAYECEGKTADGTWDLYRPEKISSRTCEGGPHDGETFKSLDYCNDLIERGGCTTMFTATRRIDQNNNGFKGSMCYDDINKTFWFDTGGDDMSLGQAALGIWSKPIYFDGVSVNQRKERWGYDSDQFEVTCGLDRGPVCTNLTFENLGLKTWNRSSIADVTPNDKARAALFGTTMGSLVGTRPDDFTDQFSNDGVPLWLFYEPFGPGKVAATWADVDGDGEMEDALVSNRGIVFTGPDISPDYGAAIGEDMRTPYDDPNTDYYSGKAFYGDDGAEVYIGGNERPARDTTVLFPTESGRMVTDTMNTFSRSPRPMFTFMFHHHTYGVLEHARRFLAARNWPATLGITMIELEDVGEVIEEISSTTDPTGLYGNSQPITAGSSSTVGRRYFEYSLGQPAECGSGTPIGSPTVPGAYTPGNYSCFGTNQQIRDLHHAGWEITTHGMDHTPQSTIFVSAGGPGKMARAYEKNKQLLGDILGVYPSHFRTNTLPVNGTNEGVQSMAAQYFDQTEILHTSATSTPVPIEYSPRLNPHGNLHSVAYAASYVIAEDDNNDLIKMAQSNGGAWVVYQIHEISQDCANTADPATCMPIAIFKDLVEKLEANDIDVVTFAEGAARSRLYHQTRTGSQNTRFAYNNFKSSPTGFPENWIEGGSGMSYTPTVEGWLDITGTSSASYIGQRVVDDLEYDKWYQAVWDVEIKTKTSADSTYISAGMLNQSGSTAAPIIWGRTWQDNATWVSNGYTGCTRCDTHVTENASVSVDGTRTQIRVRFKPNYLNNNDALVVENSYGPIFYLGMSTGFAGNVVIYDFRIEETTYNGAYMNARNNTTQIGDYDNTAQFKEPDPSVLRQGVKYNINNIPSGGSSSCKTVELVGRDVAIMEIYAETVALAGDATGVTLEFYADSGCTVLQTDTATVSVPLTTNGQSIYPSILLGNGDRGRAYMKGTADGTTGTTTQITFVLRGHRLR
jgi:peptidoglycan/xylan/chitin deacetylase (PgdA/CDA1 family)